MRKWSERLVCRENKTDQTYGCWWKLYWYRRHATRCDVYDTARVRSTQLAESISKIPSSLPETIEQATESPSASETVCRGKKNSIRLTKERTSINEQKKREGKRGSQSWLRRRLQDERRWTQLARWGQPWLGSCSCRRWVRSCSPWCYSKTTMRTKSSIKHSRWRKIQRRDMTSRATPYMTGTVTTTVWLGLPFPIVRVT